MPLKLLLTADAERDLEALYDHVVEHESVASADDLLDRILEVAGTRVVVDLTADDGRDGQELLARRLLGG